MPRHSPSDARRPRRAVLGMLGAVPVSGGLVAATGTGTAAAAPGTGAGSRRIPDKLRPGGAYDRYVADLAARDRFSGTVLVAYRGETVLARAHGMADKARSVPNRTDTSFNLASASKPFTALAIMQLVAAGTVHLHETLGTYLDGFAPQIAGTVTIHHLLTHTGGLGDFQLDPEYQANAETGWTSEAAMMDGVMAAIRREPLKYAPGAASHYSSSGIAALGAIVAAVSGQSYYDYVRDHIFVPAGMTGTAFYTKPRWKADRRIAHPYWFDDKGEAVDGLYRSPPPAPSGHKGLTPYVGNPGGGGFSTAGDLVRLDRALRRGTLLDPDHTELFMALKRPGSSSGGPVRLSGMAYGLTATLYNHHWLAGHGGGMFAGVSTNWTIYRDLEWTGVVLSNYAGRTDLGALTDMERRLISPPRASR